MAETTNKCLKYSQNFELNIPTLVYNYCQWWQKYKLQIIISKNVMAGITSKCLIFVVVQLDIAVSELFSPYKIL